MKNEESLKNILQTIHVKDGVEIYKTPTGYRDKNGKLLTRIQLWFYGIKGGELDEDDGR